MKCHMTSKSSYVTVLASGNYIHEYNEALRRNKARSLSLWFKHYTTLRPLTYSQRWLHLNISLWTLPWLQISLFQTFLSNNLSHSSFSSSGPSLRSKWLRIGFRLVGPPVLPLLATLLHFLKIHDIHLPKLFCCFFLLACIISLPLLFLPIFS